MFGELIDNTIGILSPRWAASRAAYRLRLRVTNTASGQHKAMEQMLGGRHAGGYQAGKADRLKGRTIGSPHENDVPRDQVARLRWRAWNLHRNNPQARKICRSLNAKTIGRGLSPQPQATTADGKPFVDFRRRARQIWGEFVKESDFRGKPGSGGQNFASLCKTALRSAVLSGGALYRFHHLSEDEQKRLNLYLPLQVQLIHIDRIDEREHGGNKFYGVELDAQGRVAAYHITRGGTGPTAEQTTRVSVADLKHLFVEEDIDQILGASWFGAALLTADDRRNYEYSELIAAEMASCFVGSYKRSRGQTGSIGLPNPDANYDITDAQGNKIERLQAGMFIDEGIDGEFKLHSPNRPNAGSPEFLSHLVRSEAVSMPGTKSSTVTGDYRNSSFSSERSADNDVWPEIEDIQDWFAVGFCQPIYDEAIATAVLQRRFDDIKGFSVADFNERKREYLNANWQGPVPRSINPKDDADAAQQRVKNANSSPQREAAQIGRDWREILQEIHEFIDYAEELDLPEDIWQQALGIEQKDADAAAAQARPTEQQQDDAMATNRLRQTGFVSLNSAGVP